MVTMEIARGFLWVEADSEDGFSEDDFFTTSFLGIFRCVYSWIWYIQMGIFSHGTYCKKQKKNPQKNLYQII